MNNLEKARKCFDKAVGLEIFGNYGEACDVYREGQAHYEKHIEQEGKRKDRIPDIGNMVLNEGANNDN